MFIPLLLGIQDTGSILDPVCVSLVYANHSLIVSINHNRPQESFSLRCQGPLDAPHVCISWCPCKMSMVDLCTQNTFMHVDGWRLKHAHSLLTDMRTRKIICMQKQYLHLAVFVYACVHFQNTCNISMIDYARKKWICTQLGRNQQNARCFDIFLIFLISTLLTNTFMLAKYFHA